MPLVFHDGGGKRVITYLLTKQWGKSKSNYHDEQQSQCSNNKNQSRNGCWVGNLQCLTQALDL